MQHSNEWGVRGLVYDCYNRWHFAVGSVGYFSFISSLFCKSCIFIEISMLQHAEFLLLCLCWSISFWWLTIWINVIDAYFRKIRSRLWEPCLRWCKCKYVCCIIVSSFVLRDISFQMCIFFFYSLGCRDVVFFSKISYKLHWIQGTNICLNCHFM